MPAPGGMKPAIRVQVGMHGHEFSLHGDGAHQVQKERLARTVFADHDPKGRATFDQPTDILDQCVEFAYPSHLNQVLADARNNAGAQ